MKIIDITCTGTKLIAINSLTSLQGNLKEKSRQQLDKLKRQIIKYGFSFPMFIWKNNGKNYTLDGHGRDFIIKELIVEGYKFKQKDGTTSEKIPADFIDAKDKKEAKEKLLALNSSFGRITEEGFYEYLNEPGFELDFDSLKMDLELPNIDLEKFEIGWMKDVDKDKLDDVPELQKVAVSKLGDLFLLDGRHRVLAGDSTKKEDVEKLMDGKKADMVFIDPPYGMDLDTNYSGITGSSKAMVKNQPGKVYGKVYGDNEEYNPTFLLDTFKDTKEIFMWGGDYYSKYLSRGSYFVWDKCVTKEGIVSEGAERMIGSTFELCWSKQKHKREIVRMFSRGFTSVDKSEKVHPTQKPIQLASWFYKRFSKEDDIVVDLYLGSGSFFIACEQTNRICYGMEICENYIDVILKRYHNLYPDKEIRCITRKDFNFKKLYAS